MYFLTHNAVASTIGYPRADLPPRGPATQEHQATSSVRSPVCLAAAPLAMDSPGLLPINNRDRDQTRIASLGTYLKTYVFPSFLSLSHTLFLILSPTAAVAHRCFFFFFMLASTTRSRAASPVVELARRSMWRWSGLHHRQRARLCCWCICGESTRGHPGCKGKERGRRVRRIGWRSEGRGAPMLGYSA